MRMRDILVEDIYKFLLGPRDNINEIFKGVPEGFYSCGIFQPRIPIEIQNQLQNTNQITEEDTETVDDYNDEGQFSDEGNEEDNDSIIISSKIAFSSSLNPTKFPESFGLSFICKGDKDETKSPNLDIFISWGRYFPEIIDANNRPIEFQRKQYFHSIENEPITTGQKEFSNGNGLPDDILIDIFIEEIQKNILFVSIYLINSSPIKLLENDNGIKYIKFETKDYIFQPEIRVKVNPKSCLINFDGHYDEWNTSIEDFKNSEFEKEEEYFKFIYRNKPIFGKGHYCSVYWWEIDPQNLALSLNIEEIKNSIPYKWLEKDILSDKIINLYSNPDLRTCFLPLYQINRPSMNWLYNEYVEFNAEKLSNLYDPVQLREKLDPLVNKYNDWISNQVAQFSKLAKSDKQQLIIDENLSLMKMDYERMEEGLKILETNYKARLAFCLMNKAMNMQRTWPDNKSGLNWYPFQLAFILMLIPSIVSNKDKEIIDMIWMPTGGGKTEAYLGIIGFTLVYRRLNYEGDTSFGVSVISRYTLRLLTIQQFRRALGMIQSLEYLRTLNWKPNNYDEKFKQKFWGEKEFSIGLWVGGGVTPNHLISYDTVYKLHEENRTNGAIDVLFGARSGYDGNHPKFFSDKNYLAKDSFRVLGRKNQESPGEPAQIMNCPACDTMLAIPNTDNVTEASAGGLNGEFRILVTVWDENNDLVVPTSGVDKTKLHLSTVIDKIEIAIIRDRKNNNIAILNVKIDVKDNLISPEDFDKIFSGYYIYDNTFNSRAIKSYINKNDIKRHIEGIIHQLGLDQTKILCSRPSRPGYFINYYKNDPLSFLIYCPNPDCILNDHQLIWSKKLAPIPYDQKLIELYKGSCFEELEYNKNFYLKSKRIPICALTVDDQIFHNPPSLVIATVDKFARLAFDPKCSAIFGNVEIEDLFFGYYRKFATPTRPENGKVHNHVPGTERPRSWVDCKGFYPPELILQDELHLIEGPLGSLVGIYETAIDYLSSGKSRLETSYVSQNFIPKYIASTATPRQVNLQTHSLFNRKLNQFPPMLSIEDNFFSKEVNTHVSDSEKPGRLYLGVATPKLSPITANVRIWARLLQSIFEKLGLNSDNEIDQYWTVVGYFNALKEMNGMLSKFEHDIQEYIYDYGDFRGNDHKFVGPVNLELSSQIDSTTLPSLLKKLDIRYPDKEAITTMVTTAMFGVGVDVSRLNLMIVNGQPKTTSSYIQATGRIGRNTGGLNITYYRINRQRDLDHFEYFTGYHRALYKYVEPVSVRPFSSKTRDLTLGPLIVILLRQAEAIENHKVSEDWRYNQKDQKSVSTMPGGALFMMQGRNYSELNSIIDVIINRLRGQPDTHKFDENLLRDEITRKIEAWYKLVLNLWNVPDYKKEILYYEEQNPTKSPEHHVVLGDLAHEKNNLLKMAYRRVPNSLRGVEPSTRIDK